MKKSTLKLFMLVALAFALSGLTSFAEDAPEGKAQSEAKETILIVAFGTSVEKAKKSYDQVEEQIKNAFPGYDIRWAWSAHSLLKSGSKPVLSPQEALARLGTEGIKEVSVLSLHIIPGSEYSNLVRYTQAFEGLPKGIKKIRLAPPLLYDTASMAKAAKALLKNLPEKRRPDEAVVFVGHGTHHPAGVYYPALQHYMSSLDKNVFIGTVEGDLDLKAVTFRLKASGAKKVWLAPLMTVAGDHAMNDLFGLEEDSWKNQLAENGFTVESIHKGLGEYPDIVRLWIDGLKNKEGLGH